MAIVYGTVTNTSPLILGSAIVAPNVQSGTSFQMVKANSGAITSSTNGSQCVYTLPPIGTLPAGTTFIFVNNAGATGLKITANGGNNIRLSAGSATGLGGSITSVSTNNSITLAAMHNSYWVQTAGSPETQWTIT